MLRQSLSWVFQADLFEAEQYHQDDGLYIKLNHVKYYLSSLANWVTYVVFALLSPIINISPVSFTVDDLQIWCEDTLLIDLWRKAALSGSCRSSSSFFCCFVYFFLALFFVLLWWVCLCYDGVLVNGFFVVSLASLNCFWVQPERSGHRPNFLFFWWLSWLPWRGEWQSVY